MVTLKNNYIHHVSGRAPKVAGNTLLHAINNYISDVKGHAFEIDIGAKILAEGNVIQSVPLVVEPPIGGQFFTADNTSVCSSYLGRPCQTNAVNGSGAFSGTDTDFLSNFKGKNIASANSASAVSPIPGSSGYGKI
jgi:pectin lyase